MPGPVTLTAVRPLLLAVLLIVYSTSCDSHIQEARPRRSNTRRDGQSQQEAGQQKEQHVRLRQHPSSIRHLLQQQPEQIACEASSHSPKVALLFLITHSVHHHELWTHWFKLAEGLSPGRGMPQPPPVNLTALVGRLHGSEAGEGPSGSRTARRRQVHQNAHWRRPTDSEGRHDSRVHQEQQHRLLQDLQQEPLRQQEQQQRPSEAQPTASAQPRGAVTEYSSRSRRRLSDSGSSNIRRKLHQQPQSTSGATPAQGSSVYDRQCLFTLYVHSLPSVLEGSSLFGDRVISKRVNTSNAYGQHTLVQAELRLLEEALQDPRNQRFALLGPDTLPLYPPYVLWAQLMGEGDHSRISFKAAAKDKGWVPSMQSAYLRAEHYTTASQWFVLNRAHAELAVADTHQPHIFEQRCGRNVNNINCVSDEIYFPTLLASYGLQNQTDGCGCTTYVTFRPPSWHPYSYGPGEVNATLIARLRSGYGGDCKWAETIAGAKAAFKHWKSGLAAAVTSFNEDHPLKGGPGLDAVANYVQGSGYEPMHKGCSLFARKFPEASKAALLQTMLSCEGGGYDLSCGHV